MRTVRKVQRGFRYRCDRCRSLIAAEVHLSSGDAFVTFVANLPCGHIHGSLRTGMKAVGIAWELVNDMSTEELAVAMLMLEGA